MYMPNVIFDISLDLRESDHHDNMFRRLQLLPQTRRGNIIRKMSAYFNLQVILNVPLIVMPFADVKEAANLIKQNKAKFNVYENNDEHYVVLSIVRMLDVMVGNEPFLDFKSNKHQAIKIIEDHLETVWYVYWSYVCLDFISIS